MFFSFFSYIAQDEIVDEVDMPEPNILISRTRVSVEEYKSSQEDITICKYNDYRYPSHVLLGKQISRTSDSYILFMSYFLINTNFCKNIPENYIIKCK